MDHAEIEILKSMQRSAADRAEVLSRAVRQNMRHGEFDMVTIFTPGPAFGITGSIIRCIPVKALINPVKPDQLVTNINAAIRKEYDTETRTIEVIKELYC